MNIVHLQLRGYILFRYNRATLNLIRLVKMSTSLRYDRGTLVLEGFSELPGAINSFFHYDARVDAFRASAHYYPAVIGTLRKVLTSNNAPRYRRLKLEPALTLEPY